MEKVKYKTKTMIPKTKGYTCIVKIAESALNSDTKKAKHYIKKYMIMYPDSDLIYPFTHLLAGNLNPDGLTISNSDGNYSPIAKLVWSYLKYTECDINGEHTTLIESKEVWEMIKALEFHIHDELMRLKKLARIFKEDDQFLKEATEQPSQPEPKNLCMNCGNELIGSGYCSRDCATKAFEIEQPEPNPFNIASTTKLNWENKLSEPKEEQDDYSKGWHDCLVCNGLDKPSPKEVKSAEEILLNKFPLLPHSSNKEGMDRIILAMHEYHAQFPKVVLPNEEQIQERINKGLYLNAEDKSDNVFGDIFRLGINWIKNLNK